MMHRSQTITTLLLACLVLLFAGSALAGDEKLEAFNQAYASFGALYSENKFQESLEHARTALELGRDLFGQDSDEFAKLTYNYGNNLLQLREADAARPILEEALQRLEKLHGADSVELLPSLLALGHSHARVDRRRESRKYYRRAFALAEDAYGAESTEYGWFAVNAGVDMLRLTPDRSGAKHLRTGYELLLDSLGPKHVQTGYAAYHLGGYEASRGYYSRSKEYLLLALETFELPDEPSNAFELGTHAQLVQLYELSGEREAATRHCLAIGRMTPFESTQQYFPLLKVPPQYPYSALADGSTGYTVVEYEVDEMGFVRNPRLIENTGHRDFEKASIEAALEFRYAPRFVDGKPVTVEGVQNRFTFEIR
jgi:TonB family protein